MTQPSPPVKQTRRRRGEPKRLLMESARELFARQDYRSTTTREIAEHAGIAEHLLFRNFGTKAALFREALVVPFVDLVESFSERWPTISHETAIEEEIGGEFLGSLYDLFVENRGLVTTLLAADALSEEELAEAGIRDIERALAIIGQIGSDAIDRMGLHSHTGLAPHSTVAMVAGMAAYGTILFGDRPPSREAIVEELTQMTLHGFLHRDVRSGKPKRATR